MGAPTVDLARTVFAALVTDIIFLWLNAHNIVFTSTQLRRWYHEFGIGAVLMDVIIIALVTHVGLRVASGGGASARQLLAVLALQVAHDAAFARFFYASPRGRSYVLDFFKDYADEVGVYAIVGDAAMMVSTVLLGRAVRDVADETVRALTLAVAYVGLFVLYRVPPPGVA